MSEWLFVVVLLLMMLMMTECSIRTDKLRYDRDKAAIAAGLCQDWRTAGGWVKCGS